MKITTKIELNKAVYSFEIDERNEMEALNKAIILSNPPRYCNVCKNKEGFRFDSNKDKEGNTYVNVVCNGCGAKSKLGQYKSGGFFWHKFEKYEKGTE